MYKTTGGGQEIFLGFCLHHLE